MVRGRQRQGRSRNRLRKAHGATESQPATAPAARKLNPAQGAPGTVANPGAPARSGTKVPGCAGREQVPTGARKCRRWRAVGNVSDGDGTADNRQPTGARRRRDKLNPAQGAPGPFTGPGAPPPRSTTSSKRVCWARTAATTAHGGVNATSADGNVVTSEATGAYRNPQRPRARPAPGTATRTPQVPAGP